MAVCQIEHDLQKFQIEAPFVLTLEFERLLGGTTLHHRDRFARHGEHEFGQGAELWLVFGFCSGHGGS
jgi:hypothetical protein